MIAIGSFSALGTSGAMLADGQPCLSVPAVFFAGGATLHPPHTLQLDEMAASRARNAQDVPL